MAWIITWPCQLWPDSIKKDCFSLSSLLSLFLFPLSPALFLFLFLSLFHCVSYWPFSLPFCPSFAQLLWSHGSAPFCLHASILSPGPHFPLSPRVCCVVWFLSRTPWRMPCPALPCTIFYNIWCCNSDGLFGYLYSFLRCVEVTCQDPIASLQAGSLFCNLIAGFLHLTPTDCFVLHLWPHFSLVRSLNLLWHSSSPHKS